MTAGIKPVGFHIATKIGERRVLNSFRSLFEEIVLFTFELILELIFGNSLQRLIGTHGFTLVLLDEARLTWLFSPVMPFFVKAVLQGCL